MGVPAFYRWLSEKYPETISLVKEERPPLIEGNPDYPSIDLVGANPNEVEFDNLYIDMNGIIHPCAHPEHGEQPKTEEEMYVNIMHYVDRLVAAVRPRRLLYLAIDGVAPRAKMNQQRSRRFRSAQEAEQQKEVEQEARDYMKALGHNVPPEKKHWDSNVITPGTAFMTKLSKYMHYYIRLRINTVPGWQKFKVVLSDASVPGEGEHKIMSYIRQQRSTPSYDPNQHHILHGLDADLIMLALATHEAKFTILREEVLFGKKKYEAMKALDEKRTKRAYALATGSHKRKHDEEDDALDAPVDKPLQFLHVHTLREYLTHEFEGLKQSMASLASTNFAYDFERVVDDFVFLCFFVGNDFLPHLPCLDIRDGALDYLLLVYEKQLPSLGGYLTDGGNVNLAHVDVILAEIGRVEDEIFHRRLQKERRDAERQARIKQQKRRGGADAIAAKAARGEAHAIKRRATLTNTSAAEKLRAEMNAKDGGSSTTSAIVATPITEQDDEYLGMAPEEAIKARMKHKAEEKLESYRENVNDAVRLGESGWKDRYYADKYKSDDIAHGGGREKVYRSYIEGLCWVMKYYYEGCASWEWFYPFHYAPFASDLINIDRFHDISFTLGQPFRPFEQLMGVFPAASKHAIPEPFRWLMYEVDSPIIEFYPTTIPMDPNGKAMPWLWVVLLPFIDQESLLASMAPLYSKLTKDEHYRNRRHGDEFVFFHSSNSLASCLSKQVLKEKQEIEIDMTTSASMSGTLVVCDTIELGANVPLPPKAPKSHELHEIANNQCYSFVYKMPPVRPHVCRFLDGTIIPPEVLSPPVDIKVPRLGRGISIVDLAGFTPAHRQQAFQQQQRGFGRGGGQVAPREFNQYLGPNNRQWGSMEPQQVAKRGGRSQYDNQPFSFRNNTSRGGSYRGRGYGDDNRRGGYAGRSTSSRPNYDSRRGYDRNASQAHRSGNSHHRRHEDRGGRGNSTRSSGQAIQSVFGTPQDRYSGSGAPQAHGLEALRAGLMNMHQQRGTYPSNNRQRYDRR